MASGARLVPPQARQQKIPPDGIETPKYRAIKIDNVSQLDNKKSRQTGLKQDYNQPSQNRDHLDNKKSRQTGLKHAAGGRDQKDVELLDNKKSRQTGLKPARMALVRAR